MNDSAKCALIATGLGLGLFVGGLPTLAATDDVQALYRRCTQPDRSPEVTFCIGYVWGVGDMMDFLEVSRPQHPGVTPFAMCGRPTPGAMVKAFVNWAEKNPQMWGRQMAVGVVNALKETWPCMPGQ
jgi:hypothetical protein